MINRWKSIPKELYHKIMLYQPIESPAMMAWDLAPIRMITTNELEITGTIKLNTVVFEDFEDDEYVLMPQTDAEYYMFLLNGDPW